MDIAIKSFSQLQTGELYDILQLRSEVFVVEQDCVYQDVDGKDQNAIHIMGIRDGQLLAYTRVFAPGDYFDECSIGRVVVRAVARKYGFGRMLMKASIAYIKDTYPNTTIKISAQSYLLKFYTSLGFVAVGEPYLEDGIPHTAMLLG